MNLRERLKTDLREAMKARQNRTVTTLRTLLAAIDNAEAVELTASDLPVVGKANDVPRRDLSEVQLQDIVQAEADSYQVAIADYERLGRPEQAEALRAELDIVSHYLVGPVDASHDTYHILRFERSGEADAFVRALQRFLDSPCGSTYNSEPQSAEVWGPSLVSDEPLEVYLNKVALEATEAVFAPVPIAATRLELPENTALLLRGSVLSRQT